MSSKLEARRKFFIAMFKVSGSDYDNVYRYILNYLNIRNMTIMFKIADMSPKKYRKLYKKLIKTARAMADKDGMSKLMRTSFRQLGNHIERTFSHAHVFRVFHWCIAWKNFLTTQLKYDCKLMTTPNTSCAPEWENFNCNDRIVHQYHVWKTAVNISALIIVWYGNDLPISFDEAKQVLPSNSALHSMELQARLETHNELVHMAYQAVDKVLFEAFPFVEPGNLRAAKAYIRNSLLRQMPF